MHVHLDAVGGAAGDMFAAALVDARPALEAVVAEALAALDLPEGVEARFHAHDDGMLVGRQFRVTCPDPPHSTAAGELRDWLERSSLAPAVRGRALAMLALLAEAESEVHGVAVEEVRFHELGGLDTLVDLAAAAALIEALGGPSWSCGVLPRGRGMIRIAHGTVAVPAPATLLLLRGMTLVDDGIDGERITPTGAAILRHLAPRQGSDPIPRRLLAVGHGFGPRTLEGRSNVLRAQLYEPVAGAAAERVAVIAFEVDDQTGEDLAVALDRLRALDGVLDVTQHAVTGKRGRLASHIQVLAAPEALTAVAEACLAETATIGLRWTLQDRLVLARREAVIDSGEGAFRVKIVERPGGGRTAKAEIADLAAAGDRRARERRRREVEGRAMEGEDNGESGD